MRLIPGLLLFAALLPAATEFEVASIRTNPPSTGFHFTADAPSGGPGTADPGMFRCSKCSLPTLIIRAFNLQPWQFPARTSLTETTYDIVAKIPAGAGEDEFRSMLQNLLTKRFGLASHVQEKNMKGYHLVVSKDGPKLKESTSASLAPVPGEHSHSGVMAFGSNASFRSANQTTADLARIISDQLSLPVDDKTNLQGKYDIALRWSGQSNEAPHASAYHEGRGAEPSTDTPNPGLLDAVQQQLGLKLIPAEPAPARIFVIDHISQHPTDN